MFSGIQILFTQILVFGDPADTKHLRKIFKNRLAENFILHAGQNNISRDAVIKQPYHTIAPKLNLILADG